MQKFKRIGVKGFTLIELLVVIAIIAVLAVVVILVLNPAGLLQEARDANRLSDMAALKSSVTLYLVNVPTPTIAPTSTICYVSIPTTSFTVTVSSNIPTATSTCNAWLPSTPVSGTTIVTSTPNRSVGSANGWLPVNLSLISSGAPFGQWPIDPLNNGSYFYSYTANTATNLFKIAMFMESTKYRASGTSDTESSDGGANNFVFEGGTNLSL